jgi:WWE domain
MINTYNNLNCYIIFLIMDFLQSYDILEKDIFRNKQELENIMQSNTLISEREINDMIETINDIFKKKPINLNKNYCPDCKIEVFWDNKTHIHQKIENKCITYSRNHNFCHTCQKSYDPIKETHYEIPFTNHQLNKNRIYLSSSSKSRQMIYSDSDTEYSDSDTEYYNTKNKKLLLKHNSQKNACYHWNITTHNFCYICQKVYSRNTNHCHNCHHTYPIQNAHCCECNVDWDSSLFFHCTKSKLCHKTLLKFSLHTCCICGSTDLCSCNKIIEVMVGHATEFLSKNQITNKFIPFSCSKNCDSFLKFIKGLNEVIKDKISSILEFVKNPENISVAMHGTKNIDNLGNICCQSWNAKLRSGQAHGTGEYFSTSYQTALGYTCSGRGGIVVAIIIKSELLPNKIKKIIQSSNEIWYIVNDGDDTSYCFPIGVLECKQKITNLKKYCITNRMNLLQRKIKDINLISFHYYGDNGFVAYDSITNKILINEVKKGNITCSININRNRYTIDFIKMEQRNISSDKIRNIIIKSSFLKN